MMIYTVKGAPMDEAVLKNYLRNLVNLFFKILPIRESEEPSIISYMESLQSELIGCSELIEAIHEDPMFLSLISILQYLIDHSDSAVPVYKREVFKAISICNKLKARYAVTAAVREG